MTEDDMDAYNLGRGIVLAAVFAIVIAVPFLTGWLRSMFAPN